MPLRGARCAGAGAAVTNGGRPHRLSDEAPAAGRHPAPALHPVGVAASPGVPGAWCLGQTSRGSTASSLTHNAELESGCRRSRTFGGIVAHAADESEKKSDGTMENLKATYSLDDIKGGVLFRNGLSVGYAAVAHAPLKGPQENLGVGPMPYVSVHPLTWFRADVTRTWCAASWAGRTSKESQKIANAVAAQRTQEKLGKDLPTDRKELRAVILDKEKGEGWDIDKAGAGCWTQWLGLYVGIPGTYKADVTLESNTVFQEVNPRISAGFIGSSSIRGTPSSATPVQQPQASATPPLEGPHSLRRTP